MKLFLKAYTIPFLVLLIGIGVYYFIFTESAQKYTKNTDSSLANSSDTQNGEDLSHNGSIVAIIQNPEANPSSESNNASDTLAQNNINNDNTTSSQNTDNTTDDIHIASNTSDIDSPQNSTQPVESTPTIPIDSPDIQTQNPAEQTPTQNTPAKDNDTISERDKIIYYSIVANGNVRNAPSASGAVIKKITFGQELRIDKIQDDWAMLDSGGWVSLRLLSTTEPKKSYEVMANLLNVREDASPNAAVLRSLRKGEQITITQIKDGWAHLDSGGWVSLSLIKDIP